MLFDSRAPHLNQVLLKSLDVPTPLYGIRKPYPNYESLSVASSIHLYYFLDLKLFSYEYQISTGHYRAMKLGHEIRQTVHVSAHLLTR